MHPTADYRIDQGTFPPISSTMYTPVPSPMNPRASPQSTELPRHGGHLGPHQGPQYSQVPYQGSLQGPQQQHYQTPQVYEERNTYHMQMSQSHWQMHMYHQQQSGSQMAGMNGAPNAPVGIPHPKMHQNLQEMIQDPNTGKWFYQGAQKPLGVNTRAECVSTAQNPQGTVHRNGTWAPAVTQNLHGSPQYFGAGKWHQSAGQMAGMTGAAIAPAGTPHAQIHQNPQGMIQDPNPGRCLYQGGQNPSGVNAETLGIPTAGTQNLQRVAQRFETGRMHQSAEINPQGVAQHPPTVPGGYSAVQNLPGLMRDSRTSHPTRIPLLSRSEPTKRRAKYTPYQTEKLKSRFTESSEIKKYERDELSKEIGVTSIQIKVWFQNRRQEARKEEKSKKQLETRELEEKKEELENIQQELEMTEEEVQEQMEVFELEKKEQTKETVDEEKSYYQL